MVGINTAIIARGQGIGFAIPIHMARNIVNQLKDKGEVTRGWLGVQIRDLDESLASYYKLKPFSGVYVENVVPGDPADRAGIRSGDIITTVDGQPVASGRELAGLVARIPIGKKTRIALMRDGKKKKLSVKIAKQSNGKMKIARERPDKGDLGLRVIELSSAKAQQFGLDADEHGVLVIEVAPDGRAAKAGVRVGDIIKGVNLKKINGLKDYEALLVGADQDEPINLLVRRRNQGSRGIRIDP